MTDGPNGHRSPSAPRFDLDVVFVPEAHRLDVKGTVALPPYPAARETLQFLLRTDAIDLRIEVVEPAECAGSLDIHALERMANMAATRRHETRLASPCPPGVPLVMKVEYSCGSEENRRWLNVTREFSFSSTYASAWLPAFESQRGVGAFRYSVPREMKVVATGNLESLQERGDRVVYKYVSEIPCAVDFVAGTYEVRRFDGPTPVSVYHLQPLERADEVVEMTGRIISVLEREFGPYPFAEVAIVEAPMGPSLFAGIEGSAYPGYFMVRSDMLHSGLEDWVVGHELTHFWFPYVVGHRAESGAPAMLDEALAHYGALRVVEDLRGSAAAAQFRRDGAEEAIRLTAAGFDHRLGGKSTSTRWDRIAYNYSNTKGHLVYDMLARLIGRDRFRSALHHIVREHAGEELAWADFLGSVEGDADQSLDWFYEQWFDRPGLPILSLKWTQDEDGLRVVLTQAEPPFRLVVPVQIEFSDGTAAMHSVDIDGLEDSVEIPTNQLVHSVRLDPHFTVLHATSEQWAEAEARRQVTKGKMIQDEEEYDEALDVLREGLESVAEPDPYGIEFLLRLHIGWVHQEMGRFGEALVEYEAAQAQAVRQPDFLARLYLNLATVTKELGYEKRSAWAARRVLDIERALGKETALTSQAREFL